MNDIPLPGMPSMPAVTTPKIVAAGVRFSRYTTKSTRRLCDECVRLIHRHGQAGAPYPRAARWRRTSEHDTSYLCETHKETL